MPRSAFLRRTLAIADERHHLAQADFVARVLHEGVFLNDRPGRFTGGHGVRPEEVAPFFERHGFTTLTVLASEGFVPDRQGRVAELADSDPATYQAALAVIVQTSHDPRILGMSNHLLYARQPKKRYSRRRSSYVK